MIHCTCHYIPTFWFTPVCTKRSSTKIIITLTSNPNSARLERMLIVFDYVFALRVFYWSPSDRCRAWPQKTGPVHFAAGEVTFNTPLFCY